MFKNNWLELYIIQFTKAIQCNTMNHYSQLYNIKPTTHTHNSFIHSIIWSFILLLILPFMQQVISFKSIQISVSKWRPIDILMKLQQQMSEQGSQWSELIDNAKCSDEATPLPRTYIHIDFIGSRQLTIINENAFSNSSIPCGFTMRIHGIIIGTN